MNYTGNIIKMKSRFEKEYVEYFLPIGEDLVSMNELIGKRITLKYQNQINCIKCGKQTKTSFSQGFCYNCFLTAPEADPAIINPELDQSHLGISRDMDWARTYSLVPHNVYLAISSNVKIGVTRAEQVLTRWIDQGASYAIKLAETPYRQLAGQIEVFLKDYFADKTNWRNMLTNKIPSNIDLIAEKDKAMQLLPDELKTHVISDNSVKKINYPVMHYPSKIKSLNFEKDSSFSGTLTGIKGQYLMFDNNNVVNIRKYNGYLFDISI